MRPAMRRFALIRLWAFSTTTALCVVAAWTLIIMNTVLTAAWEARSRHARVTTQVLPANQVPMGQLPAGLCHGAGPLAFSVPSLIPTLP